MEEIGVCAFYSCFDLSNLTLGDNVKTVGESAFAQCLGDTAASDVGIQNLTLGVNTREVGAKAFQDNTALRSVTLGTYTVSLGDSSFAGCVRLKDLNLNEALRTIGAHAFDGCKALETLTIPARVIKIDNCAFKDCEGLTTVTINAVNLGDCAKDSTYTGTYGHHDYDYSAFYNAGDLALGLTVRFGEGVKRVPAYLFATAYEQANGTYCRVSSVSLPLSLESIGDGAFFDCYDLWDVYYAGSEAQWAEIEIGADNGTLTDGSAGMVYDFRKTAPAPRDFQVMNISLSNESGAALTAIPQGSFYATVTVQTVKSEGSVVLLLAAYDANGQFAGKLYFVRFEDFSTGGICRISFPVDNSDGSIGMLKAFPVSSFADLVPIGAPVSFPAK